MTRIGNRLRRARNEKGYSQADLGEKVKVSQVTISNWETGKTAPDTADARRLEQLLGPLGSRSADADGKDADSSTEGGSFGAWLNRQRNERGMNVAELAQAAGVSIPAIYALEAGRIESPRSSTVEKLEKALKRTLADDDREAIRAESEIEGLGRWEEFDPHDRESLPTGAGIYVFYDVTERPIYVGESGDVRRRIGRDHEDKFWFKRPIVDLAAFLSVDDQKLRRQIEELLIKFLKSHALLNKKHVDR